MSQFHTRPFSMRFQEMGDTAEAVFEEVWPGAWEPYGPRRPKVNLAQVCEFVRCTPDYMIHNGLVEVMGCGRDQTFKLKLTKYHALQDWSEKTPVWIFLYDSHKQRWSAAALHDVVAACIEHGTTAQFHDGPEYMALHLRNWPGVWAPYVPEPVARDEDF